MLRTLRRAGPVDRAANEERVIFGRFGAGLGLGVLACALPVTGSTAALVPTGGVYITTLPSGADVWLDGTYIGRSPALAAGLTPGRHAVTATKSGWAVRELDVNVAAGAIAVAGARLLAGPRAPAQPAFGSIVLRAVPPGAKLELDAAPLTTPAGQPLTVSAGSHELTVTTAQGKTALALDVLADTTTNVVVRAPQAGVRSAVVAPAEDYLPTDAFTVSGAKIVVRYASHVVIARLGERSVRYDGVSETYDAAAEQIGSKLYLPLGLLQKLAGDTSN